MLSKETSKEMHPDNQRLTPMHWAPHHHVRSIKATHRRPRPMPIRHPTAFTLIELLVVTSIIALLIAILVPSLTQARFQSRVVVCKSHLHQIGTAITTYANARGLIPHGPDVQPLGNILEPNDGHLATNQIWTGPQEPMMNLMAMGLLTSRSLATPHIMYCPGDDTNDPEEELAKVLHHKPAPGYSSYLYRQLDETNGSGTIERLGKNGRGQEAKALALDMNSLITADPLYFRTNHKAKKVNILYLDSAVLTLNEDPRDPKYAIRDQDLPDLAARRDTILQNADATY